MSGFIQSLGRKGEQIGQIVRVISDIADQTNLLALDPAAGSASEDQVRRLAERTQRATEVIAESITAIESETQNAAEHAGPGDRTPPEAGKSLDRIVATASDVATMIHTVAAAAEESAFASEPAGDGLGSVAAVGGQPCGIRPATTAAARLAAKAEHLQALVSRFKIEHGA